MSDRLNPYLQRLQNQLGTALGGAFHAADHWGNPGSMTKALDGVRKAFDSSAVDVDARSSIVALTEFRDTGLFTSFINLKYGCFGVCLPIPDDREEWSVIGDEQLLRQLLKLVDYEREQPRRFRKCYQGLMHSYFSYPIFDENSQTAVENWKILQRYLGNRREVALSATNVPTWLLTLDRHTNLVTSRPCEPYAADLLAGNKKNLLSATEGIGIGAGSWVWQAAIVTMAEAVTESRDDDEFRRMLNSLLDVLEDDSEVTLSESVVVRCLAMVLIRYRKCSERPEHHKLRDMAVDHIGNPWLKQPAWDAYVKRDEARKMVDGWLKRRLISDFFALLSEDGSADQRRLNYWLRFEPVIDDMWFALGSHARYANSSEFREMRRRMEGRLHYLNGQGSPFNNAFLMKIGNLLIVEFGVHGNATYIFHAEDSKIDFSKQELSTFRLKGSNHLVRLIHRGDWESEFDLWLTSRIGWRPGTIVNRQPLPKTPIVSASETALLKEADFKKRKSGGKPLDLNALAQLIDEKGLKYQDKRNKEGAIWILTDDLDLIVNMKLMLLGFRYKERRGWWRE